MYFLKSIKKKVKLITKKCSEEWLEISKRINKYVRYPTHQSQTIQVANIY